MPRETDVGRIPSPCTFDKHHHVAEGTVAYVETEQLCACTRHCFVCECVCLHYTLLCVRVCACVFTRCHVSHLYLCACTRHHAFHIDKTDLYTV